MDAALVLSGVLMGAAGTPHCMAMCGASSSALNGRCGGTRSALGSFHAARAVSYAVAGAVVASSAQWLALAGVAAPALRPLWTLIHLGALALGCWLLLRGQQPRWMSLQPGLSSRQHRHLLPTAWQGMTGPQPGRSGLLRSGAWGAAWVAWPCGLLQSALIVAALASTPTAGAAVMAGFAFASAPGLWLTARVWARQGTKRKGGWLAGRAAIRISGACLVAASSWSLGHGLWESVSALCASAV